MTEQLPSSNALKALYPKFPATTNKLEAQFNFQTMTANWYGDEDNLLELNINILLPIEYNDYLAKAESAKLTHTIFADDVFSQNKEKHNQVEAFLALTEKEQTLIEQHNKLLHVIVEKKIRIVLNLIAKSLSITKI